MQKSAGEALRCRGWFGTFAAAPFAQKHDAEIPQKLQKLAGAKGWFGIDRGCGSSVHSAEMSKNLTTGGVGRQLLRLTIPGIPGFIAITAFNFTDTYFVSMLGDNPLAAMGYTFPVVMVINSIATGISMGAGSILARRLGGGDKNGARRVATSGILLALAFTAVVGTGGLVFIEPLFRALGASGEVLTLTMDYMWIWFAGCVVVMAPPVGDGNLRATGDMLRPSIVMGICAFANVILDPILIFGWGPIPAMGIAGASLATILSRSLAMVATLIFNVRAKLLMFSHLLDSDRMGVFRDWLEILFIGIPTAMVQLMPSVLRTLLTVSASGTTGPAGVAALAAGTRVESIPLLAMFAFNSALLTLIGQNHGAGRLDRVQEVRKNIGRFAWIYGLILAVGIWPLAPGAIGMFTKDPQIQALGTAYLRILFLASPGLLMFGWISVSLNAVGKPLRTLVLNVLGYGLLLVPFSMAGARLAGKISTLDPFRGMIAGLAAGYVLCGILAAVFGRVFLPKPAVDSHGS